MQKEIKGQQAKFHSKLYYPIYKDYSSRSYPMEYNATCRNLLHVFEVTQWNFVSDPQQTSQHNRAKYLECRILDVNKQEITRVGNGWKLILKTIADSSCQSFDKITITLRDKYDGERTFQNRDINAHSIAKVLKEIQAIIRFQSMFHYNESVKIEEFNQRIKVLSNNVERLQVENQLLTSENLSLNDRVKRLEGYADKVQKMTAKLKINKV